MALRTATGALAVWQPSKLAPAGLSASCCRAFSRTTTPERQIAALAARGESDKDIADRLDISARTVQAHLAHVYTKLGITKRGEILGLWIW